MEGLTQIIEASRAAGTPGTPTNETTLSAVVKYAKSQGRTRLARPFRDRGIQHGVCAWAGSLASVPGFSLGFIFVVKHSTRKARDGHVSPAHFGIGAYNTGCAHGQARLRQSLGFRLVGDAVVWIGVL